MTTTLPRADHELQMLEAMVDCAYALGMAAGDAARGAADPKEGSGALYDLFLRSFQAVRLGIRLGISLRAGVPQRAAVQPAAAPPPRPERPEPLETERLDVEALETERPEMERLETERDRDYEPVSLPRFLASLGVVARDAARLDALPLPARTGPLRTLNTLLAETARPAPPDSPPNRVIPQLVRGPHEHRAALLTSSRPAAPLPAPRAAPRAAPVKAPPPRGDTG